NLPRVTDVSPAAYRRDQITSGIAQIGLGRFHRCRQAMVVDRLLQPRNLRRGKVLDQVARYPPSTGIDTPVTYEAPGLAKYATAAATSAGSAMRCSGMALATRRTVSSGSSCSATQSAYSGVFVIPG